MPYPSQCGVIITRINRAGIGRCLAAGKAAGRTPDTVARDSLILRAVANGSIASAAQRLRLSTKTVSDTLKRYDQIAQDILG